MIGAGSEAGVQAMANLHSGGFKGTLLQADSVEGIEALPAAPDLAVFAAQPTLEMFHALAAKGTFAAVVVCPADALTELESAAASACWVRARSASRCPASA